MTTQNQTIHKILIAPDKFKGSLTSLQAANAIRRGMERKFFLPDNSLPEGSPLLGGDPLLGGTSLPEGNPLPEGGDLQLGNNSGAGCAPSDGDPGVQLQFRIVEIADGGDGSLEVLKNRIPGAKTADVTVHDPLGREVVSQILLYSLPGAEKDTFLGAEKKNVAACAENCAETRSEGCGDGFCAGNGAETRSEGCGDGFCAGNGAETRSEGCGDGFCAENGAETRSEGCVNEFCAGNGAETRSEGGELCAFIEMAKISGLAMLDKGERNPLNTSTYGLGEAICIARRMGARKITLSIGGSATDDCGAGMLQALGFEFFNRAGELIPVPICGKDLQEITRIDLPDEPVGCRIEVICDVDNPLLGENGATAVYAPQKGATPQALEILERGKANMAAVAEECLHIFPQMKLLPGAGAAGGVGYAGTAFLGGKLLSGWKFFTEITSLEEKVQWADVVITGEGSVDSQSLSGKIVGGIMGLARKWDKPVEIFCGISSLQELPQGVRCHSLASMEPDLQVCMTHAAELLEKLVSNVGK